MRDEAQAGPLEHAAQVLGVEVDGLPVEEAPPVVSQHASRERGGIAVDDDEQGLARKARRQFGGHVRGTRARLEQLVEHDQFDVVADVRDDRGDVGLVYESERLLAREPDRVDVRRRRVAHVVGHATGDEHARGRPTAVGAMHFGRVAEHVVELLADVLAILDRCVAAGRRNVEVVADLARGRVDVDDVAAPALHEAGATLVEEVALGVGAARRAADEAGVGARAHDRLGGDELEPATDLISGLSGHQRFAAAASRTAVNGQQDAGCRHRARIASAPGNRTASFTAHARGQTGLPDLRQRHRDLATIRSDFSRVDFSFLRCDACGLVFVANPRVDFAALYDAAYYRGDGADSFVNYLEEMGNPDTIRAYEWRGITRAVESLCHTRPSGGSTSAAGSGASSTSRALTAFRTSTATTRDGAPTGPASTGPRCSTTTSSATTRAASTW